MTRPRDLRSTRLNSLQRLTVPALVCLAVALFSGCSAQPLKDTKRFFQPNTPEEDLAAGIKLYRNRRYADATSSFQAAINGGLQAPDEVAAEKYLAVIACSEKRERQCRAYFTRALELNPDFDLDAAEARNPAWAPAFTGVKARQSK